MNLAHEIASRRNEFTEQLLQVAPRAPGVLEEEARQMVNGYISLVAASAAGNTDVRDDYLATVIPSVKAAGMPLGYIVRVLVLMDLKFLTLVSEENRAGLMVHCADYAERLVNAWDAAPA